MDFDLTEEQQLLRDVTREVLTRSLRHRDTPEGHRHRSRLEPRGLVQLAEIGILGSGFDPDESGPIEVMVVLTEIGGVWRPSRSPQAALIPGGLIAELGDDEQRTLLDDVAGGTTLLALAHQEPGLRGLSTRVTTRAERQGDSWTSPVVKNPVLAGDCADVFVVSAATARRWRRAVRRRRPVRVSRHSLSDLRRAARRRSSTLESASARTARRRWRRDDPRLQNALIRHQSALCAEAVGAMEEALRLTTEYLTSRKQFGVPLQHLPDADPAGRRHVRLTRTGPQHELLRRDVDRRRELRSRDRRAGQAADQPIGSPHRRRRRSSCTAASASPPSTRWGTTPLGSPPSTRRWARQTINCAR